MADIIITPGSIEIGTSYTPSGTVHKFISLANVNVAGKIAIPASTNALRIGTSSQITAASTITSAFAVIDPASITVNQETKKLLFSLILQVKYNTPTLPGMDLVDTKVYSSEVAITFPPDMSSFVLDHSFVPFIQSIGTASVVETTAGSGIYVISVPVTLGSFAINASGITNVKVPIAIE